MEEIAAYMKEAGVGEGDEAYRGIANVFRRTDAEKDGPDGKLLREASQQAEEILRKSSILDQ